MAESRLAEGRETSCDDESVEGRVRAKTIMPRLLSDISKHEHTGGAARRTSLTQLASRLPLPFHET